MAKRGVSVRYDRDLDFLEVLLENKAGYYDPLDVDDRVMVRYDNDGNIIGFAVNGITKIGSSNQPEVPKLYTLQEVASILQINLDTPCVDTSGSAISRQPACVPTAEATSASGMKT